MFRKLGHALLIAALLAATGSHWLVLQSVAWTTMLAENLHHCSLGDAIEHTFDGKHPCCLCKKIAQGKQNEKKSDFRFESKKLEFSFEPFLFVSSPPSHFWEVSPADPSSNPLTHAPPVPPPRCFA